MNAIDITISLRPAERSDFQNENGAWLFGNFFWLKSRESGQVEGPYLFYEGRDRKEFISWYKEGMVWVRL